MLIGIVSQASNIKTKPNPSYTKDDFLKYYPQFTGLLPEAVLEQYVELGQACVSEQRYGKMWKMAIGLFIAHFCSLYMQSAAEAGTPADEVLNKAEQAGIVTSESADGVSYSLDVSQVGSDLNGWAAFKLTTFGQQFATIAKLVGKGGIYVW